MGLSVIPIVLIAVGGWLLWWGNQRRRSLGGVLVLLGATLAIAFA